MMDFQTRNQLIGAWNQAAAYACEQAQALEDDWYEQVEDHAGMIGDRPIPAARLIGTSEPSCSPAHEETPDMSPVAEPEPAVTLEDVRGVLAELSAQGHTAKIRELIVATGADKLSAVDPSKYGWLLEQAKELSDA
ncbi:hypothetical protein FRC0024_00076 [Corynebacterium diphtheriae]|uniref:hypothetical protein n=1 Tax=Corynebacterium diphtheriae TaxID=1717 RepID=UPI0013C7EC62|nr:hypothetical protein [Corynebacterium diphtheriae]CAB0673346.1 hypothetical protein FRC0024_00076 [Corynebacterium diphtheriae]CAB0713515.1 hypothetical protein FRC0032_02097 [Corynebacterium diphtheriae]CAB0740080.1 hypothetical protein FRC0101_02067 [Corynebacterium diphtheriae]CAB0761354.1 hypothetical protein FRC0114_02066 [Corynebacterium diphtheriae]CAB0761355.1 hypothetical protein FRC0150_02113 [Corynebacterium diphtheriae]